MSFGKVKEAVRALKAKGELLPHLKPGQIHKRIWDQLVEDGYDPRTELPSRRSLDRYLRLLVADATCAICPTCASPAGILSGNVEPDDVPREDDEMTQADPKACLDITEALRQYLLAVPDRHTIDEALSADYLRNLVGKVNLKPDDGIMLRAADFSWTAQLLVVSVARATRTVTAKIVQAPTYLLSSVDRSQEYLLEQINELEHAHQAMKVGHAEYESRSRTLQHLKEFGHYPTKWLRGQFAALDRAFDAQLLTRQQHHNATQELRAVMTDAQVDEVFGSGAAAQAPASNETHRPKSRRRRSRRS